VTQCTKQENSELQFIQTTEGRLVPDGNGGYDYEYALKDLPIAIGTGNTRVMFDQTGEVLQDQSYYPFGMIMGEALTFDMPSSLPDNKYLYNGKELQDDFDLGWYDYGARFYDPQLGRWHVPDPLAENYYNLSTYNYVANNPLIYIDPDGMRIDPIYNIRGKLIGDDGKSDGKIHIVYNNSQANDIENQTKNGNTNISLVNNDVVTLHGGESTVNGVVASVGAQYKDTGRDPNSSDAGLHEEGGHTEKGVNGESTIVQWEPGPKKSETGAGSINIFNGISRSEYPSSSELLDYWHVHTSESIEINTSSGPMIKMGSMYPSGKPGKPGGDIGMAQNLESNGYKATAIQVGTSKGVSNIKVNFYNSNGKITSMKFRNFKKLKND
jgi:RHS repeat-associated protein